MVPACLPIPPSLHVEALVLGEDGLTILASSEATDVRCPVCGTPAARVHGRYRRTLADLPWAGVAVRVRVQVRKFFCSAGDPTWGTYVGRIDAAGRFDRVTLIR